MGRKPKPWVDRFWNKVDKTIDCWLWTGCKNNKGYGRFYGPDREYTTAHRLSWIFHNGPIPDGLCICHTCDNPACVRPEHLFLGTHTENMADMRRKGRAVWTMSIPQRGEKNGHARLTTQDIIAIRELANIKITHIEIARKFGICRQHVSDIVKRNRWAHVP